MAPARSARASGRPPTAARTRRAASAVEHVVEGHREQHDALPQALVRHWCWICRMASLARDSEHLRAGRVDEAHDADLARQQRLRPECATRSSTGTSRPRDRGQLVGPWSRRGEPGGEVSLDVDLLAGGRSWAEVGRPRGRPAARGSTGGASAGDASPRPRPLRDVVRAARHDRCRVPKFMMCARPRP